MPENTIVDEIRRARIAYAERFNFDLKAIAQDLREQEKRSGRALVSIPPRRATLVGSPGKDAPA
jgi:hypothetical protein